MIIANCTQISVHHGAIESRQGRYEARVQAKYIREMLDSGLIVRDTKREATAIAVGIIVKSIEMVDNGERGSKSSNNRPGSKAARKPVRPKTT